MEAARSTEAVAIAASASGMTRARRILFPGCEVFGPTPTAHTTVPGGSTAFFATTSTPSRTITRPPA